MALLTQEADLQLCYLLEYKPGMPEAGMPDRLAEAVPWLEESAMMLHKALRPYASVNIGRTAGCVWSLLYWV